jgi:xanthine dehydrogenase YagS FAD-binding subunit
MHAFTLLAAKSAPEAIAAQAVAGTAQLGAAVRFIAGGTNLVDYMKLEVETPAQLVDINALPLADINAGPDGGLVIGALARNADVAAHAAVRANYPVLSQALLSGASPQLRNMATTAGNLLQKTRCSYYRDVAARCNKRVPGSGCDAMEGWHRMHALLGTSEQCIATHPSDQNVALVALDATVQVQGVAGSRSIPLADFHLLPGNTPHVETLLEAGDLITAVLLPPPQPGARGAYLKLRDRAAYEFALASAAVLLTRAADGTIAFARVALGGVATVPWRSREAEATLQGHPATEATFNAAADAALRDASPRRHNAFKVELARRCIVAALRQAAGAA